MENLGSTRLGAWVAAMVLRALPISACGDHATNPENELPSGVVDVPKAGDALQPGRTLVGGWAVDDSAVLEIRIYFDGRYKTSTSLNVPRPDVAKALPRYARRGDIHSWNARSISAWPPARTILIQAVDDSGATRDIGVIPVTVPQ